MDSEDAFFDKENSVYERYSDSESEEETLSVVSDTKKKVTPAQSEKLFLFMNGRAGFSKGKTKPTEEANLFLNEWNQLTTELNAMGPPSHPSSKWRRVWTRIKSKKKRKLSRSSVLRDHNKRIKDQRCTSASLSNPTKPTSSVKHGNVIITNDNVESDHSQKIDLPLLESISNSLSNPINPPSSTSNDEVESKNSRKIELCLLESISKKIDSFVKQQGLVNEELNKKIDLVIERQTITNNIENENIILANIFTDDVI